MQRWMPKEYRLGTLDYLRFQEEVLSLFGKYPLPGSTVRSYCDVPTTLSGAAPYGVCLVCGDGEAQVTIGEIMGEICELKGGPWPC